MGLNVIPPLHARILSAFQKVMHRSTVKDWSLPPKALYAITSIEGKASTPPHRPHRFPSPSCLSGVKFAFLVLDIDVGKALREPAGDDRIGVEGAQRFFQHLRQADIAALVKNARFRIAVCSMRVNGVILHPAQWKMTTTRASPPYTPLKLASPSVPSISSAVLSR